MKEDDERGRAGTWGIGLFLGVFVLAGLGALCMGFVELARGGTDREGLIALLGVGTLFTLVPGALLIGLLTAMEKAKDITRRKGEFPDEPWRWREDWNGGILSSAFPGRIYLHWLFGLVFSAVGVLLLYNWQDVMRDGPKGYVFLSVPILGGLILFTAIIGTLRHLKWRDMVCELQTIPGAIGGRLVANIRTPVAPAEIDSIEMRLTCYYYSPESGTDTGHGMRTELWREAQTIPAASVGMDAQGNALIPVDYAIPSTCEASTAEMKPDRVQWELSVTAKAAGINLSAMYIVPVFQVAGEQAISSVESLAPEMSAARSPKILTKECGDEIEFHYADSVPSVLVALVFSISTAIHFAAFAYFQSRASMPLVIWIGFAFFFFPLVYATLWLWFGKRYVHLSPTSLTEVSSMLGFSRRKAIPLGEIVLVDAQVDGRSGKTLYYAIRVHTDSGVRLVLKGIRDKAEADVLVRQIEAYLVRHRHGAA
jgi:hypothetical protein